MAEGQDDAQKTEDPTQKRLQDALKRGQTANSREVTSFFILLAFVFIAVGMAPYLMNEAKLSLSRFIMSPADIALDFGNLRQLAAETMLDVLAIVAMPMGLAIIAIFASSLVQNRFIFSVEPIKPKFEKISPLKGLKRLFSMRTMVEFTKGVLKIGIVGTVGTIAVMPFLEQFRLLPDGDLLDMLAFVQMLMTRMLLGMCFVMFLVAALDFAYQKFEYIKSLKMTKQEVKDEYKQQEGDPLVKQKIRQIRMERARKRMMSQVPEADVVITNPTHYAIALKYDAYTMEAPQVMAKGKDKVAHRIRDVAEDHKITVVRNPPLARGLFDTANVDDMIPLEYFQAVAEVISYVYKLKGIDPEILKQQKAPN